MANEKHCFYTKGIRAWACECHLHDALTQLICPFTFGTFGTFTFGKLIDSVKPEKNDLVVIPETSKWMKIRTSRLSCHFFSYWSTCLRYSNGVSEKLEAAPILL